MSAKLKLVPANHVGASPMILKPTFICPEAFLHHSWKDHAMAYKQDGVAVVIFGQSETAALKTTKLDNTGVERFDAYVAELLPVTANNIVEFIYSPIITGPVQFQHITQGGQKTIHLPDAIQNHYTRFAQYMQKYCPAPKLNELSQAQRRFDEFSKADNGYCAAVQFERSVDAIRHDYMTPPSAKAIDDIA